jgi:hypothetical protein
MFHNIHNRPGLTGKVTSKKKKKILLYLYLEPLDNSVVFQAMILFHKMLFVSTMKVKEYGCQRNSYKKHKISILLLVILLCEMH